MTENIDKVYSSILVNIWHDLWLCFNIKHQVSVISPSKMKEM